MKRKIKYRLTCRLGGLTPANTENRGCPAGLQHDLGEKKKGRGSGVSPLGSTGPRRHHWLAPSIAEASWRRITEDISFPS